MIFQPPFWRSFLCQDNWFTIYEETAASELWASFYAGTFLKHEEYYREYFPESVAFFEAMSADMKH